MTGFDLGPALLFCPADRPDRFDKAIRRADAVILDLEDAVRPADKRAARDAITSHPLDPTRTVVRVNPAGTPDFAEDLVALARTDYRWVMLPKTESAADVAALGDRYGVIALCETAAGVLAAPEIARVDSVRALMWGAEDLLASLGGTSSRHADGSYRQVARHARSHVLLAAGAAGKTAIDSVYLDIADLDGLHAEVADAVASGFSATACIHPTQVPTIRDAFLPDEAQIEGAEALLTAAETEQGVFRFRGRMVDEPALRHARSILRLRAKNDEN
ncbi:HpcH/HpaI aldolase/citrate lyase family protein [Mycetocola zhadangensis]|uniref:CoA ester lyase n=1 Tax=Mycetocola zhadangensis TaxID=1164595 RepID=A0A3L7IT33_9MICO|nr:CoA ester lyase [Mycetocola zhadangensis]RLQ81309.1 CoA ester lyase [Mycetocola zhadangensis]GGF02875.1 CoA ester lyase [Mycetocola zhadangensis]